MAINKVIYGQTTLIDITDTTVTSDVVAAGYYFYGADGVKAQGTLLDGDLLSYGDTSAPIANVGRVDFAILGNDD